MNYISLFKKHLMNGIVTLGGGYAIIPILVIALLLQLYVENKAVAAMLAGIRPAVVALMTISVFHLAKEAKITLVNCWIPILSALVIALMGINPIWVILAAGIGGYIYGRFIQPTE